MQLKFEKFTRIVAYLPRYGNGVELNVQIYVHKRQE